MDEVTPASGSPDAVPFKPPIGNALSWMAFAQLATQMTSLGALVVLGRLLPPAAFGSVAAGMVVVSVATLLMGAGTYGSIVTARQMTSRMARDAVLLNFSIGVALSAVAVLFAGPIVRTFARDGDPTVLRGLAASIAAYSLAVVPVALLIKHLQSRRYAAVAVVATFVSAATAVVLALLDGGVWALVLRQVTYQSLLAAGAWFAVRDLLPNRCDIQVTDESQPRREGGRWFFLLALSDFVAFNADYAVIGRLVGARDLGLYSLAFALALVPLRQFVWQVGGVFLAAAAGEANSEAVRRQLIRAIRLAAVVLVPLAPPAVVLASVVVPAVLGEEWHPMVPALRILVMVGVMHALVNIVGEFLGGRGHIAFRARVSCAWAVATVVLLPVAVSLDGIRGAALTHAVLVVPLAAVYAVEGGRLLGFAAPGIASALRPIAIGSVAQIVVTVATYIVGGRFPIGPALRSSAAAVAGLVTVVVLLVHDSSGPVKETISAVRDLRRRRAGTAG